MYILIFSVTDYESFIWPTLSITRALIWNFPLSLLSNIPQIWQAVRTFPVSPGFWVLGFIRMKTSDWPAHPDWTGGTERWVWEFTEGWEQQHSSVLEAVRKSLFCCSSGLFDWFLSGKNLTHHWLFCHTYKHCWFTTSNGLMHCRLCMVNKLIKKNQPIMCQFVEWKINVRNLVKHYVNYIKTVLKFFSVQTLYSCCLLYKLYRISDDLLIQKSKKVEAQLRPFSSSELVNCLKSCTTCSKK